MEFVNLRQWLDAHEVSIDELGTDNVADACREALRDLLVEDAIDSYIQNNSSRIAYELASEIAGLSPSEVLKFAEHLMKKKNEDWRMFITDTEGEYDWFYHEHEEEFKEWLRSHGKKVFDNDIDNEDYYLGEGIDTFLEFAYELLGGEHMFDFDHEPNLFSVYPADVLTDDYEDELIEYLEGNLHNFTEEEWFREWLKGAYESEIEDYISPDDYYPMWNYAWEFPASYDPAELNKEMNGMGLIFFELNGVLYVTLATAGMSMMPALYYAYAIYSDLNIDPKEIAQDMVSHGVGYYKYIIKEWRLAKLAEHIGYDIEKLDEISRRDYENFSNLLNQLKEEMDEGKISRMEAALLGMAAMGQRPDVDGAKTH